MPRAEYTKLMIARGLKELMEHTPFSSLSVSDIARKCGISRNTFYYHFKDKYDIIHWIFHTEITPIICDSSATANWSHGLSDLCSYLRVNKKFYLNVLQVQGQNSFSECLMDFYQTFVQNILLHANGDLILSRQEIRLISRFYAHGLTGAILDWAKTGMTADPSPTLQMLDGLISGEILRKILTLQYSDAWPANQLSAF